MAKRAVKLKELEAVSARLGDVVIDPAVWPEIMEQFCGAVGATGAALLQSDARTTDIPRTATVDESFRRYFAEGWHVRDGRQKSVPLLLAGQKVVTDQDICTPEEIERSDFYQDLLASYGFKWFSGIGFWSGPALWLLTFQRTPQEGPFSRAEADLLATLSSRLSEVATLLDSVGRIALTSTIHALDSIGHPTIAIDRLGRVLDTNAAAEQLFDPELYVRSGRICVADERAKNALQDLLAVLKAGSDSEPIRAASIVVRRKRGPIVLRALPVHGATRSPFVGARALLILTDLSRRIVPPADMLAQTFQLSPAEARLATLMASGVSPERAAEELGIARETVRNQLKAIFSKTGTHRQSELVALLSKL